jgi:TolB-like protein
MQGEEICFGRFRFDGGRRELTRDGVLIKLGSRALDVLAVLASAKGDVVSKDDLIGRVWPGVTVEENNLQVQVSALRKILDGEDDGQSHLVTVPGRGYRLAGLSVAAGPGLALPDKPSIAVLPFQNMSDDPRQEYFADGIAEDIITALCRIRWLFVIARNSSFAYKGRSLDVKEVGRELGVRYVLEGGVRKAAERVRITTQLIDAANGAHLWAQNFDGGLADIFDLQDQVTASVVGTISPKLMQAEIDRIKHKPTDSLDAYDCFLRGMECAHRFTREGTTEALGHFAKAIERDPAFATPHGAAAFCYLVRKINGWLNPAEDVPEAGRLAARAAELGQDDAVALAYAGIALGYVAGDLDGAIALVERAIALNPNLAIAWYASGTVRAFRGDDPDLAIEHLARAMRLSPLDPLLFTMQGVTAFSHFFAGRYDEAVAWAEKAFWERPNILATLRIAAVSNAYAGRREQARKAVARIRLLDPGMRLSNLRERIGIFRRPADYKKYAEGLRMAGLPE